MEFIKITESDSNHNNLELKTTKDLVNIINTEDMTVAKSVKKILPKLTELIDNIYKKMLNGGRLFYIGAGTSGRLGILDASECPPTFGVSDKLVIGLIAGGDKAIRKSYCARSAGQMKRFQKAAKDPNSRLRQARRRWRC